MLNRRGLTLLELMISILLLAIVGMATTSLVRSMITTTTAQVRIAAAQGNARSGILAIPQELREVGYDTVANNNTISSDLLSLGANRITFRAMRGMGITCGTPTTMEFRVRKPIIGAREPLATDGFLLYLESDPNLVGDDQWVPMLVQSIDYNSTCGADSAIAFTLSAEPIYTPPNQKMAISQHFVGGPIRWFEVIEYGPIVDAMTNQAFIGVRSISLAQGALTPIIGPLPDTASFAFTYYNAAGAVLNPAVALPTDVRSIGLMIKTVVNSVVSLAGTSKRKLVRDSVQTRIALRNAIRP
jgi:prepilin-type N-terminal cleavage/methylation domain-containing protein